MCDLEITANRNQAPNGHGDGENSLVLLKRSGDPAFAGYFSCPQDVPLGVPIRGHIRGDKMTFTGQPTKLGRVEGSKLVRTDQGPNRDQRKRMRREAMAATSNATREQPTAKEDRQRRSRGIVTTGRRVGPDVSVILSARPAPARADKALVVNSKSGVSRLAPWCGPFDEAASNGEDFCRYFILSEPSRRQIVDDRKPGKFKRRVAPPCFRG